MSSIPFPMNSAHQHAANADEYLNNGLLVPAADEHLKAAEAYLAAIECSHDESTRRTLQLLYNEHSKSAKDLQRKIVKLKDEGKDPSLPHKLPPPSTQIPRPSRHLNFPRSTPSTPPLRPMSDSQNTVDESFMLLAGQHSDPGDAFNQFWNIMQGMLNNLSEPVAFATVPLGDTQVSSGTRSPPPPKGEGSLSSDTDSADEPIFARLSRRIGITRNSKNSISESNAAKTLSSDDDFEAGSFDEETLGDELSESFFVIPSGNEPSPAALKKENLRLRAEVEASKKQLEVMERRLQLRKEQDLQLRGSIFEATKEVQKAMGASMIGQRPLNLDFNGLNVPVPLPGKNSGREAQYARRLKEVEDELQALRTENEKHKAIIVKFRERWEKLKDSAKRKKEAKAAAASLATQERIVEEPEAEDALDGE